MRILTAFLALALLGLLAGAGFAADKDGGFIGKDLAGWEGLEGLWTYQNGSLVGETREPQKFNTFLCSKKKYRDFELSFQVKLTGKGWGGNSGVQVRSHVHDPKHFAVSGPQADMGDVYWGSLYGENFGGMMKQAPGDVVKKVLKKDDFNDYTIRVLGKHVTIKLNGATTVDQEFPKLPDEGIIAFQMHGGPPMRVEFKNIQFHELKK